MPDTHAQRSALPANRIGALAAHGQSCWLDDLTRRMIRSGDLAELVRKGVHGVTANPATFAKAVTGSRDYDADIARAAAAGDSAAGIYRRLITADVREACDVLRPIYDETDGCDGFVSLEVSPHLAHDTAGSIAETMQLWTEVGRPNLFIKIPGTQEGVPAIERCLADGVNINITLLFSVERYVAVAEAYLRALEHRAAAGAPIAPIASVASFFLSRIDVLIDRLLAEGPDAEGRRLSGKVAIANAKLAYENFGRLFAGARWQALADRGARVQRLLWASTSTKNPDYPDLMYVEPLIGAATVNTMPIGTIEAVLDHGEVQRATIEEGVADARTTMTALAGIGIDFAAVARQLEDEGVEKFIEAFDETMRHIEAKRLAALGDGPRRRGAG